MTPPALSQSLPADPGRSRLEPRRPGPQGQATALELAGFSGHGWELASVYNRAWIAYPLGGLESRVLPSQEGGWMCSCPIPQRQLDVDNFRTSPAQPVNELWRSRALSTTLARSSSPASPALWTRVESPAIADGISTADGGFPRDGRAPQVQHSQHLAQLAAAPLHNLGLPLLLR